MLDINYYLFELIYLSLASTVLVNILNFYSQVELHGSAFRL